MDLKPYTVRTSWSLSLNVLIAEEMFAVSSVFLGDTLPFPLDIEPPRVDLSALDKEAFAKFKKIKKIKFISKSLFETYKNDLEKI